jgi:LysR family transcriptional activator of dmlA
VRPYPGTVRGLFASQNYLKDAGDLSTPDDLQLHNCVGSGPWKLSRGKKVVTPDILFRVVTSDPTVALKLALGGFGIVILPLWMANGPEVRKALVQILPQWVPEPITLCALFSSPSRLTPKVQVLLDFLDEYLGTDRDPRLKNDVAAGYFSDRSLTPTSGP